MTSVREKQFLMFSMWTLDGECCFIFMNQNILEVRCSILPEWRTSCSPHCAGRLYLWLYKSHEPGERGTALSFVHFQHLVTWLNISPSQISSTGLKTNWVLLLLCTHSHGIVERHAGILGAVSLNNHIFCYEDGPTRHNLKVLNSSDELTAAG